MVQIIWVFGTVRVKTPEFTTWILFIMKIKVAGNETEKVMRSLHYNLIADLWKQVISSVTVLAVFIF